MLPATVERVRIFACDWPADLLQSSGLVQKRIDEYALLLLDGIQRRPSAANGAGGEDRPLFFIASCLGGIILIKALVEADNKQSCYRRLRRATRGIIFLATPFRGTSFQDVAAWAELGLKAWASVRGREPSRLLESVKGSTLDLEALVRRFTQLCQDNDHPCHVFNFYELGMTSLPSKVFPWLPAWLRQEKLLVDSSSAILDIVKDPLPLDRPHLLMNKFEHPKCPDYEKIAGKIKEVLQKIREGSPLKQADAWIRDKRYAADMLKIERLSGDLLTMDYCYINLAVVEQSSRNASHSEEQDPARSSFSLLARQKVETPIETNQVELAAIFNKRQGRDGREIQPRRILIRGQAGVGKTTLCKKMVHDFTQAKQSGLHRAWTNLFDRLLWVPLRNLKGRSAAGYGYEDLFYHEFFSRLGKVDGYRHANELWRNLRDTFGGRSLFLLNGLDEISEELSHDDDMSRFIRDLLNQPNVIITSRPNANIPAGLRNPDLELETIGFYPAQVTAYLNADPKIQPRAEEVQSYLQKHWLIQGLVRIPIQLDALCYTWEDFDTGAVPDTMTRIYKAIEQRLWKKDDVRLERAREAFAKSARPVEIEGRVRREIELLECLAFDGLHHDIIDFTPSHRNEIAERFPLQPDSHLSLDETLTRVSFLRTSDPSTKTEDRNYHFLHLTFQEYFAARYFVRQWTDRKQLEFAFKGKQSTSDPPTDPAEYLRSNKYSAQHDVLWRFVAGLLDDKGEEEVLRFFKVIEEEPFDLLGPTHQRLVMHCLSEVDPSTELPIRSNLEAKLLQWVLFECQYTKHSQLVREMEFPPRVLDEVLRQAHQNARTILLRSLRNRPAMPPSSASLVASWLEDNVRRDVLHLLDVLSRQPALPDEVLKAIAAQLDHGDSGVRRAVIQALGSRLELSAKVLGAIIAQLKHEDLGVRRAAIKALGSRSGLSGEVLEEIAAQLNHKNSGVRRATIKTLGSRLELSDEVLKMIVARFSDKASDVRWAAIETLGSRSGFSDEVLEAIAARLDDEDSWARWAAIKTLESQPKLPDEVLEALVARLDDEDSGVRWAAIEALRSRPKLSNEVLKATAARLDDKDPDVRGATIEVLGSLPSLPYEVLEPYVSSLYSVSLGMSFSEHWYWPVANGKSYLAMGIS